MDIVASGVNYMIDVDKTQNIILNIPWFHTPASHFSTTWHRGKYWQETNGDNAIIPHLWLYFFAHPSPEIITIRNTKETASKGNIWGPFYMSKGEGWCGG